mgnify:CR=1 FL=1
MFVIGLPMLMDRSAILVIDDEQDTRELMELELSAEGYDVEGAADGFSAVRLVRGGRRFDLAIADYRMPGMNGLETLRALKALDPDMQVIVASGCASRESVRECLQSGAHGYLEKPFDFSELAVMIRSALSVNALASHGSILR